MDWNFTVSVIIPVYNAAKYVEAAVNSAVHLKEVGEIILVEDGSPDNALEVCKTLDDRFKKVRLFQHPGGENRGAGASRNLGIDKSLSNYVAFLDADDLYLPNRFTKDAEILSGNREVDGVYSAAGFIKNNNMVPNSLYTIKERIPPKELFTALVRGTYGHFCTNNITLRKSVFERTGNFNNDLRLGQDAELWLRIAFHCSIHAGEINEATSLIRRHDENRILHINDKIRIEGLKTSINYFKHQQVAFKDYLILVAKLYRIYLKRKMIKSMLRDCQFFFGKIN